MPDETPEEMTATSLRDRFAERRKARRLQLIADVAARRPDVAHDEVEDRVDEVLSERPLLDWLAGLDWEELILLILKLLPLFMAKDEQHTA